MSFTNVSKSEQELTLRRLEWQSFSTRWAVSMNWVLGYIMCAQNWYTCRRRFRSDSCRMVRTEI